MDSDRILVLDQGEVAEYDSPSNLLAIENGHFKGMVNAASAAGSMTTSASGNHLVGLDEAK
jgi:ABC-type antimicrobial peptide transport system ATPase subunit